MEQQSLHSRSSGIIHPSEIVEQDWIVSSRSVYADRLRDLQENKLPAINLG
jgi:hypothetical protein